jgi:uncharacterized protein YdiU (UPF0061 family)
MIEFNNTYIKLPEKFYERVNPASFSAPELILFNKDLARELGINSEGMSDEELAKIFSGQKILKGSEPLAQAYAGFQFGNPVPQLGDGRAHLLGETNGFDIQLKGSGQTRFSRQGDGRSSLGPVVREYIVSEAMHHLGVPTTRALAAVRTGENVFRQTQEPGGIFTRVANSHLRVGTFQYFAFRKDLDGLETLLNYAIKRHYPELSNIHDSKEKTLEFVKAVTKAQAELVSSWMALGFIHGVMNTDNFSISGITIDFGPCAFMDEFRFEKVFSYIDQHGRYAFFNQPPIAGWNILRLADTLLPFIDEDHKKATVIAEKEISTVMDLFTVKTWEKLGKKIGLNDFKSGDEKLIVEFLKYLEKEELDFNMSFRNFPKLIEGDFEGYPDTDELKSFLMNWKSRVGTLENPDDLNKINPRYIPRNHQVERAIQASFNGDDSVFKELVELLKDPYGFNQDLDHYHLPPKPDERVTQTFCGT